MLFRRPSLKLLLDKHGVPHELEGEYPRDATAALTESVCEATSATQLGNLLQEIARTERTLRSEVEPRYRFEQRWEDLLLCLELDGYRAGRSQVPGGTTRVVAIEPTIDGVEAVDDDLSKQLKATEIPNTDEIARLLDSSATAFRDREFNACLTNARGICLAGDFSTNTGLKWAWEAKVQSRERVAFDPMVSRIASTVTMPRGGNRTQPPACRRVRWRPSPGHSGHPPPDPTADSRSRGSGTRRGGLRGTGRASKRWFGGGPAYASGGGSPRASGPIGSGAHISSTAPVAARAATRAAGTAGSAARNIVAINGGRSRSRWRAVRTTLDSTCWVSAPRRVRLPPHTLRMTTAGRMACSARQFGGVERGVPQEEEHGQEFGDQVIGETHCVFQRRRCVDQPAEPGDESAAGRRHAVLAQFSRVAAVAQVKGGPKGRLHLAGPGTVGMVLLEFLAASEKVVQTRLVLGVVVTAVRRPPVAHEHARVVGPQHGGGIGEPATAADGVDRRVRGGVRPEPVAIAADAPAGFVRRDHGRVANLLAQFRVGRPGVAGGAVQQVDKAARRDLQVEVGPQQVGDLGQRRPHLRVQLDDQRSDAGAELRAGRAQRVGGLQGVAALHPSPALRAVADLDVEPAHDRAHLGQFFLILRRHAGHLDRAAAVRARRGDRRYVGFVDPRRAGTAAVPPVLRTGPPAGPLAVTLRPVLGEGRRLPATGAPRRLQLLFQVVVLAFQTVDLALKCLDARVARIPLRPGRVRTAAFALLTSHTPCIGTCARNLHTTSRIFSPRPANQRPRGLPYRRSRHPLHGSSLHGRGMRTRARSPVGLGGRSSPT